MKYILNCLYQKYFYKHFYLLKIFIIFFLIIWIIRNLFYIQLNRTNLDIKIISQFKIDSNNKIVILKVHDMRLILGITLHNMHVLCTLPISDKFTHHDGQNNKPKFNILFWNKILFQCIIFVTLLCYSFNAYSIELSELTKHVILNNMYYWPFSTQIVLLTCIVTMLSVVILMTTSFTRIIIVLSLLRNAIGIPSLPPNQLLLSISLCLTGFIMYPTYYRIYQEAYLPFYAHQIPINDVITKCVRPIYDFMIHQTRQLDLLTFCNLAHIKLSSHTMVPIQILLPSFITSELKTAFQIGFTIFIPFLIIDLFVASVLMSLGMMMISPNTISLPIKLILFVVVDGWQLIFSSLVHSFY